jgi:hypothetical protein
VSRAQRLPASEALALRERCGEETGPGVLNAFRHQRLLHSTLLPAVCRHASAQRLPASEALARPARPQARERAKVLNAFRHQRLLHPSSSYSCCIQPRCSTPSGIRGSCTRRARRSPPHGQGAQRLPASEALAHQRLELRVTQQEMVLNAFRHQRLLHTQEENEHAQGPRVLNAFRHQRLLHLVAQLPRLAGESRAQRLPASEALAPAGAGADGWPCWCSTPSGIRGSCTRSIGRIYGGSSCAQRLPASEALAPHSQIQADPGQDGCSTPSGIRGSCTQTPLQPYTFSYRVLNAFRHQRLLHPLLRVLHFAHVVCSTPSGIRGSCTVRVPDNSATAFRCSTPSGIRGSCTPAGGRFSSRFASCSTPSGIRGSCTPILSSAGLGSQRRVLNAFRHQRLLHPPVGLVQTRTEPKCAQRLPASEALALALISQPLSIFAFWCSTPSGIRGSCTSLCGGEVVQLLMVLNAFRHQRLLHHQFPAGSKSHYGCSTPSGIRGSCTFGYEKHVTAPLTRAQRLPASEALAPLRSECQASRGAVVLNAFRHQRLLHRGDWKASIRKHFLARHSRNRI